MRLLVFSDIHNNEHSLRALRQREANIYDALVIAGDVGNQIAGKFLDLCQSFECPAFFVHGNWDHEQPYLMRPRSRCILLHHQIEELDEFYFAGFSGHPIAWGQNPFHLQALSEIDVRHPSVVAKLSAIKASMAESIARLDQEFAAKGIYLRELKKRRKKSDAAHRKARENLCNWREEQFHSICELEFEYKRTEAYAIYDLEQSSCVEQTQMRNRRHLLSEIRAAGIQQDRLILVTHERQHKLSEDGLTPLLHIFGHRHRYECTKFKGTNYLNAASLDSPLVHTGDRVIRKPGGYCRVDISAGNVHVERVLHAARSVLDKTVVVP